MEAVTQQNPLFPELPPEQAEADLAPATDLSSVEDKPARPKGARVPKSTVQVGLHPPEEAVLALAAALPRQLRLGTSSWTYPGWAGLLWDGHYPETALSKQGLAAYGQHPLLRTVSLDRNFYRALTASQYARYAGQVPADFRFVVKAPSLVTDALVRAENGRGMQANPAFLNPDLAVQEFIVPALEGLGQHIGALVFQLSPLPPQWLGRLPDVLQRLRSLLAALPSSLPTAPDGVVAVEVRDPAFITTHAAAFAKVLRDTGATYCLGLHPKLPPLEDQLPLLRALWPGPLVCRWNMNRIHGPYGYEDAEKLYEPFGQLIDPDPETRLALAKVIAGTVGRGQNAFVTISNHAEGSAPQTIVSLAEEIRLRLERP
ncbi:MAG: hypothetical protein JWP29_1722 [Rhodoferax sp.]|nr:hypothetical protein [Rhodoferax sp.]